MIRIEIVTADVKERPITAKNGKQYVFREQEAWAGLIQPNGQPERHPAKFSISLDREQGAYPPGFYTVAPESLYINKYGTLDMGRLRLKAVAASTSQRTGT